MKRNNIVTIDIIEWRKMFLGINSLIKQESRWWRVIVNFALVYIICSILVGFNIFNINNWFEAVVGVLILISSILLVYFFIYTYYAKVFSNTYRIDEYITSAIEVLLGFISLNWLARIYNIFIAKIPDKKLLHWFVGLVFIDLIIERYSPGQREGK